MPACGQEDQNDGENKADQNLKEELSPPRQPFVLLVPDLLVIVIKSDNPESHCRTQSEPHKNVAEVRPEQRGNHNAEKDQDAAHGGCSCLGLMRFRPVLPNVLADLKFLELPYYPRP